MRRPTLNELTARAARPVEHLGSWGLRNLDGLGRCGMQFAEAMTWALRPPFRVALLFKQMEFIGNKSLGVVLLTGLFTGMVMTFQIYRALRDFSSESIVGGLVAVSMARELGPVLSALMVNARAGSAIAAEVGTMRVTEQIDALFALGVNPVQYLFTPRVLAGMLMVPLLTAIANVTGVAGGYLVGVMLLGVDGGIFMAKVYDFVSLGDIMQGTVKAAVFGLLLTQIGAYKGFNTSGGAEGVGRATTEAVVVSAVSILFSDYLITVFWQS
ncbi:MAG: ABC transporter permease [Candidatus Lambdaproteobacteria bacterium]|nr:ABC transporter permease [Candidatus Lambdaproteobacteria bacterium]